VITQHILASLQRAISGANLLALVLLWLTVLVSVAWSYVHQGLPLTWRGFWRHALPPASVAHPSARADVLFFISSKLVNTILVAPAAFTAFGVGTFVNHLRQHLVPYPAATDSPAGITALLLFTATMFLAYDFSYYIYHNAQHRVPILWELHKVHHSAEVMVGVTKDRIHPLDNLMNHIWDGLFVGPIFAIWLFFVRDPVELAVFGINIYVLRNILMMDFVRHTHFKISFGERLNGLVICPHYHQLHHSSAAEHWDKNFGLMLAIWDRMFGTLAVPKPDEAFTFGLTNNEHVAYRSCLRLYFLPLLRIAQMTIALSRGSSPGDVSELRINRETR
jgi:sterol desaturase/sphingolipid hydroxylase (fatty acid hydroxylase superfamily)